MLKQQSVTSQLPRVEAHPAVVAAQAKLDRIHAKINEYQHELQQVERRLMSDTPATVGVDVDRVLAGDLADDTTHRRELQGAIRSLRAAAVQASQAVANAEYIAAAEIEPLVRDERLKLAADVVAKYDALLAAQRAESQFLDRIESAGYSLGRIPGRTLWQARLPTPLDEDDPARRETVEIIADYRKG